ncbi:MAG: DUF1311 domain-containing protein [Magnetococcales bacterium]|nr:DUF1311 domain-containing protein [Magnetococcales bacterium]NGZ25761.1 DUF1311 domain-containing protein [Magnetococcales bacterium]
MSRFFYVLPILLWALSPVPQAVADQSKEGPGFDCDKATYPVEHLICSDDDLMRLDRQMTERYRQLRQEASEANEILLVDDQRAWVRKRLSDCNIPTKASGKLKDRPALIACLQDQYTERLAQWSSPPKVAKGDAERPQRTPPRLGKGDAESPMVGKGEVISFSPTGVMPKVRQVVVRFNNPMVNFGDPRLAPPFDMQCPEAGTGRWIDGKQWVFDFNRDLPPGLTCTFTLKPELAQQGKNKQKFSFSTGGPERIFSWPYEEYDINDEQVFILGFNSYVDPASIRDHVSCAVPGVGERIGVNIVTGKDRGALLAAQKENYQLRSYFETLLGVSQASDLSKDAEKQGLIRLPAGSNPQEQFQKMLDAPDSPLVTLQCKQRFPAEEKIQLVVGEGIRTPSGVVQQTPSSLEYKVQKTFHAKFSCSRFRKEAGCIPSLSMSLYFNRPLNDAQSGAVVLKDEKGVRYPGKVDTEGWENHAGSMITFAGPFPASHNLTLEIPAALQDETGRPLTNQKAFPMVVRTDKEGPMAKFPSEFSIVEQKEDALIPITVRNLENLAPKSKGKPTPALPQIQGKMLRLDPPAIQNGRLSFGVMEWFKKVKEVRKDLDEQFEPKKPGYDSVLEDISEDRLTTFTLPRTTSEQEMEVIGIPLQKSGVHVLEVVSDRLGEALHDEQHPYHVSTIALATNLSIHFKEGAESSLGWVTSLDQGKPVAGARLVVANCNGAIYFNGTTDDKGLARIELALPKEAERPSCGEKWQRDLLVVAMLGDDYSFLLSRWGEGIQPTDFNLKTSYQTDSLRHTTILDRPLFRAGEEVHMKHVVRLGSGKGFTRINASQLPSQLTIQHQGSEQKVHLPLKWDEKGVAESLWKIPKEAKQGSYEITMESGTNSWTSGSFRVESFRIPTMKAALTPPSQVPIAAKQVALDAQLNYLSGGVARLAPVQIRGMLETKEVTFPGYDEFTFAMGGVTTPANQAKDDLLRLQNMLWDETEGESSDKKSIPLPVQSLNLDRNGTARVVMDQLDQLLPLPYRPRGLLAEMVYQDDNGERLTTATRLTLWPSQVVLGLKQDHWMMNRENFKLTLVALDTQGKPMANVPVSMEVLEKKVITHRKRLVGGFYAFDHQQEVKSHGILCSGKSDARGLLVCETPPPVTGTLLVEARAMDGEGRESRTHQEVWVAGDKEWWFEMGNHDRMDLIPEKPAYEPGEEAVFQVRMPFREATALVTVEREGVLEQFVTQLSGKEPVVKVAMKGHYAPNVFVSVLAVRGRINETQPTALVDLGRPSFRVGLAKLQVGWREHKLDVKVSTDKPAYRVRSQMVAEIAVTPPTGKPLPAGAEVAVAVVDEGLLLLKDNESWNLLATMMQERGIFIQNATTQRQVVGKRHYGRKAVAPGGGGGQQGMRELFETLLSWQGRVPLDAQGRAKVTIPVNDSLTAFRVVAVAMAGDDLFGTGSTSVRTTQELILRSGLSPMIRQGDRFRASFTVQNADTVSHTLEVRAKPFVETREGKVEPLTGVSLSPVPLTLEAGSSGEAAWEVTAPNKGQTLQWQVEATTANSSLKDALKIRQKMVAPYPMRTLQATLSQVKDDNSWPMALPKGALPDQAEIQVNLQSSMVGELLAVQEYFQRYPYTCLEQQVSKSVGLRQKERWQQIVASLPHYLDGDGLAKYFPLMSRGSDVLTSYVLALAHEAGWQIPAETQDRMIQGLTKFVGGQILRDSPVPTMDLALRKVAAMEALSRYGEKNVLGDWLTGLEIQPKRWPTATVVEWLSLLQRLPNLDKAPLWSKEAKAVLRARLNFQGTRMGFSTEKEDHLWWLMQSPDNSGNRLILAVLQDAEWREDLPKLVRGSLDRQKQGVWSTTTANAWGRLAMDKFVNLMEKTPIRGQTQVTMSDTKEPRIWNWDKSPKGGILSLPFPPQPQQMQLAHTGQGSPWVTVSSVASVPLQEPLFSGYRIKRTVTPVEKRLPDQWSRGDVLRVGLEIEAQTDMTWVVASDAIPAGSTVLGTGLGLESQTLLQGEAKKGWNGPTFEERTHEGFRAYYEWLPKGSHKVEYTVRLNSSGTFQLPATRVEAMYAPEMFGEAPVEPITITP